ncbi:hypothetical protein MKW98_003364 [Papaver atlanticum]|uniref:Fe2OG dioxygenase domain-containing protein n=1 Tax=Papaver atlanticum TaxID=357466 RepID=A0AAD4TBT5_9MAGN|nr:hypothetical protein MKW98_003364 [Papaver atlanticum]
MENARMKVVTKFDESMIGVKGLLDSGIKSTPLIFVHPPDQYSGLNATTTMHGEIPVIDFSDMNISNNRRSEIIDQIKEASSTWGVFQIINHGIPEIVIDEVISSVRFFHEQPNEIKNMYYVPSNKNKYYGESQCFSFISNTDIYLSKAASWRDTLKLVVGPDLPLIEKIPEICRKGLMGWANHGTLFGEKLIELMCEGLGVRPGKLKEMRCTESRLLLGQFYPYCPQPDLTADQIGGLQVKRENLWVNVAPIEGAITVNVGDFFQIISNDNYKSVEHRVLANRSAESRISVPLLFHPAGVSNVDDDSGYYGPLPELLSAENPARYKVFTLAEFWKQNQSKAICSKNLTNAFSIVRDDDNSS